jgi:hypothetical protein
MVDVDDTQARIAINEATFRKVNEGIEARHDPADPSLAIICECGRLGCNLVVDVTPRLYENVRADSRRFIVRAGHELPDAERVVERHGDLLVVEKEETAGVIADRTDPRAPLDD